MENLIKCIGVIGLAGAVGCQTTVSSAPDLQPSESDALARDLDAAGAAVRAVSVTGEPGDYSFAVTVASPDTGCDRYADWWEVVSDDGQLLYRRILLHSHVDEQPFTRSGGPVPVQANETILVRAHMNDRGYGTQVLQGSIQDGFESVILDPALFPEVATQPPLPQDCNF
ncbi:hypothetical protein IQ254_13630 [Nodosilinea sp. LEGE 07088]|uniref:hypothetical protein n=1 Tax=Nodosilinea sp. LEGE 07088 TaxID=2777968 RepID=UPI001880024B|nr:hypothetical protein [Nodosilinea sp. LEGE 07088]MBE9138214.1 hypothetical protein [Nodosilinea sp. LEGE 07088]